MSDLTLPSITTSTGTTVTLTTRAYGTAVEHADEREGDVVVILDNPAAPDSDRHVEAGRIVYDGRGFQPAPFFPAALSIEVLRAIADLMEASRG